jgi:hypothetical protein
MKRAIFIGLVCLALALPSFAAKYAGEFLEIGIGGRGVGMGGAMTAHTEDPMSFYWNPAGMAYVSGLHVSGMYADLWNGLANYSVAGLAMPLTGAVLGAHWVRLGVPDIQRHPDYDNLQFPIVVGPDTAHNVQEYLLLRHAAPQGMFTDNESAIFLTFAKQNAFTLDLGWSYFSVPIELPVGANVKIINQKLGSTGGSGIGADFGFQLRVPTSELIYEPWKAKLAYGFNWQDATRTAVDWGENNKDAIPSNLRHGFALIQKVPGRDSKVTLSWDLEKRWEMTHHFGVEYNYAKVISLRGGLWGEEWTAGAGLALWRVSVDYAYLSRELGTTHRISLSLRMK